MAAKSTAIRTGTFRYVVWNSIDDYHKRGWMVETVLGDYSVLMWRCECLRLA